MLPPSGEAPHLQAEPGPGTAAAGGMEGGRGEGRKEGRQAGGEGAGGSPEVLRDGERNLGLPVAVRLRIGDADNDASPNPCHCRNHASIIGSIHFSSLLCCPHLFLLGDWWTSSLKDLVPNTFGQSA